MTTKREDTNARNALRVIEERKREKARKARQRAHRERDKRIRAEEQDHARKISITTGLALNAERHKTLIQAARLGLPYNACAALAGVTKRTFLYWRTEGEQIARRLEEAGEVTIPASLSERDKALLKLYVEFHLAEAEAQRTAVGVVFASMSDDRDWKAALEFLKARWSKQYTRQPDVTINNSNTNTLATQVQIILPDNGRGDRQIDNSALPPIDIDDEESD